jgi:hypothetical protein
MRVKTVTDRAFTVHCPSFWPVDRKQWGGCVHEQRLKKCGALPVLCVQVWAQVPPFFGVTPIAPSSVIDDCT